jgi:hypothetical protein
MNQLLNLYEIIAISEKKKTYLRRNGKQQRIKTVCSARGDGAEKLRNTKERESGEAPLADVDSVASLND